MIVSGCGCFSAFAVADIWCSNGFAHFLRDFGFVLWTEECLSISVIFGAFVEAVLFMRI